MQSYSIEIRDFSIKCRQIYYTWIRWEIELCLLKPRFFLVVWITLRDSEIFEIRYVVFVATRREQGIYTPLGGSFLSG